MIPHYVVRCSVPERSKMRLLKTSTVEFEEFLENPKPAYAICLIDGLETSVRSKTSSKDATSTLPGMRRCKTFANLCGRNTRRTIGSGWTHVASTRGVAPKRRRPSIQCMNGTKKPRLASCISKTYRVKGRLAWTSDAPLSRPVSGSNEAGLCRNCWLQSTSSSAITHGTSMGLGSNLRRVLPRPPASINPF